MNWATKRISEDIARDLNVIVDQLEVMKKVLRSTDSKETTVETAGYLWLKKMPKDWDLPLDIRSLAAAVVEFLDETREEIRERTASEARGRGRLEEKIDPCGILEHSREELYDSFANVVVDDSWMLVLACMHGNWDDDAHKDINLLYVAGTVLARLREIDPELNVALPGLAAYARVHCNSGNAEEAFEQIRGTIIRGLRVAT